MMGAQLWFAALLLGAAPACALEVGPGCPADLVAEPNGEDGNLFFVNGGYVQDGLWKQLTIPKILTPDSFYVTTGTITFYEPSCATGALGFPLVDADGNLQCEWDVDSGTSSNSCTPPQVDQDLDGAMVETTAKGTNVVLGFQSLPEGIAIQVGCDLSLTGGKTDLECALCDSGVHVVLREPNGNVRSEDTIWITCDRATKFSMKYVGLVGENATYDDIGTVHVGDEFLVHYYLHGSDPSRYPDPRGHGMVPLDANPAFEVVSYLYPSGSPPRLHLRALAPADQPHLRAGTIEGTVPVVILP
jgi:hypothetical protein